MKYLLLTLIYIIRDWDLSMDEFKPIGKILFWIPNFLHNLIVVLFRLIISPLLILWFIVYDKYSSIILRFFVYWKQSLMDFVERVS